MVFSVFRENVEWKNFIFLLFKVPFVFAQGIHRQESLFVSTVSIGMIDRNENENEVAKRMELYKIVQLNGDDDVTNDLHNSPFYMKGNS